MVRLQTCSSSTLLDIVIQGLAAPLALGRFPNLGRSQRKLGNRSTLPAQRRQLTEFVFKSGPPPRWSRRWWTNWPCRWGTTRRTKSLTRSSRVSRRYMKPYFPSSFFHRQVIYELVWSDITYPHPTATFRSDC